MKNSVDEMAQTIFHMGNIAGVITRHKKVCRNPECRVVLQLQQVLIEMLNEVAGKINFQLFGGAEKPAGKGVDGLPLI